MPFASTMSIPVPPARSGQKKSSSPPGRKPPAPLIFRSTANGFSPATTCCSSIGCEYASIFAALGVRVTLIDKRDRLLPFVDHEIVDEFSHHLRENRVTLRLNESVGRLEIIEDEHGPRVRLHLDSGKTIIAEKALYSVGRTGATSKVNLAEAGLAPDNRGRLVVDEHYRTQVPGIYAVGDMIGFPALASTSMEQGRLAVCHAFGAKAQSVPERFP